MSNIEEIGVDQIKSLMGPPPLMMGESEPEYWEWCSVFIEARKPKTLPDCLEVYELAQKRGNKNVCANAARRS